MRLKIVYISYPEILIFFNFKKFFLKEILTTPPWFARGYNFGINNQFIENEKSVKQNETSDSNFINLVDLLKGGQHLLEVTNSSFELENEEDKHENKNDTEEISVEESDVISSIPNVCFFDNILKFIYIFMYMYESAIFYNKNFYV